MLGGTIAAAIALVAIGFVSGGIMTWLALKVGEPFNDDPYGDFPFITAEEIEAITRKDRGGGSASSDDLHREEGL